MDHLLFCINHEGKIAKRHCKKCDQNLCNDCVFDLHIEHHTQIEKIKYSIDTKQVNYSEILSKEINAVIEQTLKELKPQISKLVLEKTEEYIKEHKNLQLKLTQPKEDKMPQPKEDKISQPKEDKISQPKEDKIPQPKEERTKPLKPTVKDNIKTVDEKNNLQNPILSGKNSSKISQRAKLFENDKFQTHKINREDSKNIAKKNSVHAMAKLFEQDKK